MTAIFVKVGLRLGTWKSRFERNANNSETIANVKTGGKQKFTVAIQN